MQRRECVTAPGTLWVYLAASPLLWLTVTLAAWLIAEALARQSGRHPLINPVLIAIVVVAVILGVSGTPYAVYFEGAQFVHFLLGPATVALAVPLFRHRAAVRRNLLPMAAALVAGSITAVVSIVGIAAALGVPQPLLLALAPKSVTAGIAMGVAESLGGNPALTAVFTVTTGIAGAVMVTPLMNALGVRDYAARGFAAGLASHGIGTARAFTVDPLAGTFAGIALGLNGVVTPFIVPLLVRLWI
jgi:predicted murein hydrolase (TIGR00659 family)